MRTRTAVIPVAALALVFGALDANAQQRERRNRGQGQQSERSSRDESAGRGRSEERADRGSRARDEGRGRRRDQEANREASTQQRPEARPEYRPEVRNRNDARPRGGDGGSVRRDSDAGTRSAGSDRYQNRNQSDTPSRSAYDRNQYGNRSDSRAVQRGSSRTYDGASSRTYDGRQGGSRGGYGSNPYGGRSADGRYDSRFDRNDRGTYSRNYYAPRLLSRRTTSRRYYGSGGHLSVYFGTGSGYRYGSPYSGRVYGYRGRGVAYGGYRYFGDVRLKVTPRDAAVYVDGYYAGIVDDFDGFFQRLTLEVGPHEIEIEAPGVEPQAFDVYVDSSRTIDLHADLFR